MELRPVIDAIFPGDSWAPWRAAAAALYALPPVAGELELFERCTGRKEWPTVPAREGWFICGRRAGKSVFLSRLTVVQTFFRDYRRLLSPGEWGVAALIAADRAQAQVDFRYIEGVIDALPAMSTKVISRTRDRIELDGRIAIEVTTCSYRAPRGRTVVIAVGDECAFWSDETGANPDTEVLNALRPAMATIPGALLLCGSTPYRRAGVLWRAHRDHYGREHDPVLVWHADSRTMNPTIPQAVVDAAYADDEAVAASEYGAEWRRDIETFISREALDACVVPGRRELPPGVAA